MCMCVSAVFGSSHGHARMVWFSRVACREAHGVLSSASQQGWMAQVWADIITARTAQSSADAARYLTSRDNEAHPQSHPRVLGRGQHACSLNKRTCKRTHAEDERRRDVVASRRGRQSGGEGRGKDGRTWDAGEGTEGKRREEWWCDWLNGQINLHHAQDEQRRRQASSPLFRARWRGRVLCGSVEDVLLKKRK